MPNNKIVVTGGSGFIGTYLIAALHESGEIVLNIDLKGEDNFTENVSLNDYKEISKIIKSFNPDYIIHCAGGTAEKYRMSYLDAFDHQFNGTKNISKISKENFCKKLIFLSSDHVYCGFNSLETVDESLALNLSITPSDIDHRSFFGLSKAIAETICLDSNNAVILRLASIYGVGDCSNVVGAMIEQATNNKQIEVWGSGNRQVQFTYLIDIINAIIVALELNPGIYNISNHEKHSIKKASEIISNLTGVDVIFNLDKKEGPQFPYVSNKKFINNAVNFAFTNITEGIKSMLKDY